jgi:hypothetical protein
MLRPPDRVDEDGRAASGAEDLEAWSVSGLDVPPWRS